MRDASAALDRAERTNQHSFSRPCLSHSMKLEPNLATSEAGFLFNPATGDSFAANPLAADILARARAGQDAAANADPKRR